MPNNERERRMSMLRAALPYTAGNQRHALEVLLQVNTLVNTARYGAGNDLEACDTEARPEEMLLQIQEFCTPRESDLVQMILNFIKANHLFQNYREFMANLPEGNHDSDVSAAGYSKGSSASPVSMLFQLLGGLGNPGNSNHLIEFLMTQLPPEQRQLFQQLQNLSETGMFSQNPAGPADGSRESPSPGNFHGTNPSQATANTAPFDSQQAYTSDLAAAEIR